MAIQGEYTKTTILLMFLLFSHVGWIWEVLYATSWHGFFVNRGFMHGPWLPVYGLGAVLMIILLNPIRTRLWLVFFLGAVIGGALEYGTSLLMEMIFHIKWWDYSGAGFDLQGRTCLLVIVIFGILGVVITAFLGPFLNQQFMHISANVQRQLAWIIGLLFLTDYVYSLICPNMGAGITCN